MEVIPTFSAMLSDWEAEPLDVESERWTEALSGKPKERREYFHLQIFFAYIPKMRADAILQCGVSGLSRRRQRFTWSVQHLGVRGGSEHGYCFCCSSKEEGDYTVVPKKNTFSSYKFFSDEI